MLSQISRVGQVIVFFLKCVTVVGGNKETTYRGKLAAQALHLRTLARW